METAKPVPIPACHSAASAGSVAAVTAKYQRSRACHEVHHGRTKRQRHVMTRRGGQEATVSPIKSTGMAQPGMNRGESQ
jgi:hypothetical protein